MAYSTTRVGSRLMAATHPSEILADDKHDNLHGRPNVVVGRGEARHEFAEVLTLPKLHAEVVGPDNTHVMLL